MNKVIEYECPSCGGTLEFDSSIQKMKCPYCDSEFEMEAMLAHDEELKNARPDNFEWQTSAGSEWSESDKNQFTVYICKSCGGEIIADENTAATVCPYCDNNVMLSGRLSQELKPDIVIPFKLDKNAAKEAYKKHISGKRLLPKAFKTENHIDEIKGIYVPFWMFNTTSDGEFLYKATKVRHWSDVNYDYTETSHFSVKRAGRIAFKDIPVDGSSKTDDDMMESIEPFNMAEAVDFQTAYLAGYLADKYDVDSVQSEKRASDRVKTSTENEFRSTIHGYNSVITDGGSVVLENSTVRYALCPVWLLNTTYKGKKYVFAMNGQTGKMVGDLPVDKKRFWGYWAAFAAGFSTIASLVAIFLT